MTGKTMAAILYNCIPAAEVLLALLCIARVLYLEPALESRRGKLGYTAAFFCCAVLEQIFFAADKNGAAVSPLIFFCIHTWIVRKTHRVRGLFLMLPVLGYLMGLTALFYAVPYTLTGHFLSPGGWMYMVDGIFWISAGLICWKKEKASHVLGLDAPYRKLGRWERNFLHSAGFFLFIIGSMMIAVKETGMPQETSRIFSGFGCISALLLEISVIMLIRQGNKRDYFQYMTTIGEHYLKTELDHFRAYQEREKMIRRFRHDIRNHFICLKEMAGRGNLSGVKEYIEELQGSFGDGEKFFQSGNEIVDAILNEKNVLAREKNIEILLEGRLPLNIPVKATDLCTIFANALDNALEAAERQQNEKRKWIYIRIRRQNAMLALVFRNPADAEAVSREGETGKENKKDHGFGIMNIRYAAEKYRGSVHRWTDTKDGDIEYVLEVLLFLTDSSAS